MVCSWDIFFLSCWDAHDKRKWDDFYLMVWRISSSVLRTSIVELQPRHDLHTEIFRVGTSHRRPTWECLNGRAPVSFPESGVRQNRDVRANLPRPGWLLMQRAWAWVAPAGHYRITHSFYGTATGSGCGKSYELEVKVDSESALSLAKLLIFRVCFFWRDLTPRLESSRDSTFFSSLAF